MSAQATTQDYFPDINLLSLFQQERECTKLDVVLLPF